MILRLIFALIILASTIADSAEIQLIKKSRLAKSSRGDWGDEVFSSQSFAVNTDTGETLIVWAAPFGRDSATVFGRIIDPKGKPITKNLRLAEPGGHPTVAYNPVTHEYLLAYDEANFNLPSHIYVQRLDTKARPLGNPVPISTDPTVSSYLSFAPTVLFNPKTNGYAIFWSVHTEGVPGVTGLYGGVLLTDRGEPAGSFLKIADFIQNPPGSAGLVATVSDWVYLPSADKLLGIYREFDRVGPPFKVNYWLAVVDPKLKKIDKSKFLKINKATILTQSRSNYDTSFHLALISDNFAAAFFLDQDGKLKGRRIDSDGKIRGKAFKVLQDPIKDTSLFGVHAAFTETSLGTRGILIGTERDANGNAKAWAQILTESGKPLESPVEVLAVSGTPYIFGRTLALPSSPDDAAFRFLALENTFFDTPQKNSPIYRLLLDLIP